MLTPDDKLWLRVLTESAIQAIVEALKDEAAAKEAVRAFTEIMRDRWSSR